MLFLRVGRFDPLIGHPQSYPRPHYPFGNLARWQLALHFRWLRGGALALREKPPSHKNVGNIR